MSLEKFTKSNENLEFKNSDGVGQEYSTPQIKKYFENSQEKLNDVFSNKELEDIKINSERKLISFLEKDFFSQEDLEYLKGEVKLSEEARISFFKKTEDENISVSSNQGFRIQVGHYTHMFQFSHDLDSVINNIHYNSSLEMSQDNFKYNLETGGEFRNLFLQKINISEKNLKKLKEILNSLVMFDDTFGDTDIGNFDEYAYAYFY